MSVTLSNSRPLPVPLVPLAIWTVSQDGSLLEIVQDVFEKTFAVECSTDAPGDHADGETSRVVEEEVLPKTLR